MPLAEGTLELVLHNLFDEVTQAKVLTLTDNLPTGYHAVVGQASGKGIRRGVVGDGAVGFLATHTAGLFGPAAVILLGHHDERGRLLGITVAVVGRDLAAAVVIRGRSRPVPSAERTVAIRQREERLFAAAISPGRL